MNYDRARDQSSLDADVLGVGERGAQIEIANVDGRPVGVLRNHCVDEEL
jgi:hypothetical protein